MEYSEKGSLMTHDLEENPKLSFDIENIKNYFKDIVEGLMYCKIFKKKFFIRLTPFFLPDKKYMEEISIIKI